MVNIRYVTTEEEKQKVLSAYFKEGLSGQLDTFPSKEKRKLIILQNISERFELGRVYSEIEINEVLKTIYGDFATIRRELIVYGFMNRSTDCSEYWIKED
ncbi:DUF2087 domain-containing protein [Bacillus sp. D386]|uniref:DUF2087 domain-containing protein n=1 Tax=Bacillus sp. D386 TaxID=2587155 RepID=UPI00111F2985|nr:DUF2087 domain-containing protein [Bacillus sp. D386]